MSRNREGENLCRSSTTFNIDELEGTKLRTPTGCCFRIVHYYLASSMNHLDQFENLYFVKAQPKNRTKEVQSNKQVQ